MHDDGTFVTDIVATAHCGKGGVCQSGQLVSFNELRVV